MFNRNTIDTASYNRERKEADDFSHYYSFYDYAGNIILYPVAAYATVYGNEWVSCRSHIYEWLENQSKPIKYNELVSHFNYIASITTTKPPIFDVDFRALTQILAVIAPPASASKLQKILPDISDIADNTYGVAIGTSDELEVSLIKKKLQENNLIIANVNKKPYENKFLIWVTASSDFLPTQNNLDNPDSMQKYWQSRHLQIQNDEVNKPLYPTFVSNKDLIEVQTKQITGSFSSKTSINPGTTSFLSEMNNSGDTRFCQINSQTSVKQLFDLALKAQANKDTYRLSQCLFEIYTRCLPSWKYHEIGSPNNKHVAFASSSLPSPSPHQISDASFFIKSLKTYALELNQLLRNADQFFWNNFYKKYSPSQRNEIHSFFNLISYISNNMHELDMRFNETAIMKSIHISSNDKTNSTINIYMKELMDSINKPRTNNFR